MRRVFKQDETEALFWKDGAVTSQLLTPDEITDLASFYLSDPPPSETGFHATVFNDDPAYRARVDAKVKSILWPKLEAHFADYIPLLGTFVVKHHHREESEVAIHQDWSFVDETVARSINVWIPLIDTDRNNGGLFIFKGSHHMEPAARGPFYPSPLREHTSVLIEKYLSELPLRAGEAIIYDHSLIHASPENISNQTRIAANLVLVPRECQVIHCFFGEGLPPGACEVFSVQQDFFLRNNMRARPEGVPSLGLLQQNSAPLTADHLSRLQEAAAGPTSRTEVYSS